MKDRSYVKGVATGVLTTVMVILAVVVTVMFFNIGNLGNLVQTVRIMDRFSLEPLSLSEKTEGAITGIVAELEDPYSYYLDEEEYGALMEEVSGSYEGLGIYLTTFLDAEYTVVMAPIKGTPAFEAGLLAGDEIIKINGKDMAGVGADEIASMIKTGEESHFVMEVRRDGEMLTFEMDREHIDIPSVEGSFLEGQQGMAYIAISNFAQNTPLELSDTIAELEKEHPINGIILDLRNNPGGSVESVIAVANLFLSQGDHIMWVEEKKNETCYDAENANPLAYPVVVLVNENSASASEILSGALKENNRATLVGVTTFGKGIIQSVYTLSGDVGVKVTTAEYLSPEKNKIHEVGVTPHIEVEMASDDVSAIYSLDPTIDNQLAEAIKALGKQIQ
ncbi:MAG: PDZ domain-containing protein [Firmicutes bacterium]|nr:PDZ domain-containing protein [Bacillota bacterium]